jgi:phage protein D
MLLHPAYKLTIGDKIVDTTDEPQASTAVSLTVTLDMDTPADSFTLLLGQVGGFQPRRDDEAKIELGFSDGELTQVMAGQVITTDSGLTRRRVIGHSPAQKLLESFTNQTYEAKTAGQIVSDLADQAGVSVARAEDGITFPAYVVDGRISFYHHMRALADLCGFDLYINADGELVFARFLNGNAIHIFDYAKQIVELELLQTPPAAAEVQTWGESPGSGQGDESWAWLTKDFDGYKGTGGSGSAVQLLERPALRTAEAALAAANAAHTDLTRRTLRGVLLSTGQPKVKLGDAVQLRNLPDSGFNGTYQVRSVTHHLDKSDGFTTRIGFRAI